MRKTTSKIEQKEVSPGLHLTLPAIVAEDLFTLVHSVGMQALQQLLEMERTQLCGPRYEHAPERAASRHGSTQGALVLGGRRVRVQRPRVRSHDGREVPLPTWERFSQEDPLDRRATEQMLVGVSTRKYARSLEPLPDDIDDFGTSKSAVSRRFVKQTEAQVQEFLSRPLSEIPFCALMIDGVHVAEHVMLIAVGIDHTGNKHVLGVRQGATENATSCRELLCDLRDRGLCTERSLLFVLDGSKALRKAVVDVFGKRAVIQRCRVHKQRNVLEQLPKDLQSSVRHTMQQAYSSLDSARAKKQLENLARSLEVDHPGAASSLREGLDETLTVTRLALPDALVRSLMSTNLIENLIDSVRKLSARVQHWRDGQMALRWTCATAMDAAKRFRRIKGHKGIPKLLQALSDHDHKLELEPQRQAA